MCGHTGQHPHATLSAQSSILQGPRLAAAAAGRSRSANSRRTVTRPDAYNICTCRFLGSLQPLLADPGVLTAGTHTTPHAHTPHTRVRYSQTQGPRLAAAAAGRSRSANSRRLRRRRSRARRSSVTFCRGLRCAALCAAGGRASSQRWRRRRRLLRLRGAGGRGGGGDGSHFRAAAGAVALGAPSKARFLTRAHGC